MSLDMRVKMRQEGKVTVEGFSGGAGREEQEAIEGLSS